MTNPELAAKLRDQADALMTERKALLCASVALSTTKTTAGARKAIREWDGPAVVRDRAIELLTEIEG